VDATGVWPVWFSIRAWPGVFSGVNLHQLWIDGASHNLDLHPVSFCVGFGSLDADSGTGDIFGDISCCFLSVCPITVAVDRLLSGPTGVDGRARGLSLVVGSKNFFGKLTHSP